MHAQKHSPKQGRHGKLSPGPSPSHGYTKKPETLMTPTDARKNKHNYHSNHQKTATSGNNHKWWGRPDSNRGPRGPKPRILDQA